MKVFSRVWILLFCVSLPVLAQQSSSTTAPASKAAADNSNRQTTIDVVVDDKSQKPVPGLQQQDFTLIDNGHPQPILSFEAITSGATTRLNPPVEAIFVVDTVNENFEVLSRERQQLEKFFTQNGGQLPLPVRIAFFSHSEVKIQPTASRDGKTELDFLSQNETELNVLTRDQGAIGAFDKIGRSLRALRTIGIQYLNTPGRKLLIWMSHGWPIPPAPTMDLDEKDKQQAFDTVVTIAGLMRLSRITVYSVDPSGNSSAGGLDSNRYKTFMNELKKPSQAEVGNTALQVTAIQTGGRIFIGGNDLVSQIESCIQDADAFYTITFGIPRPAHPSEYHRIEVKVDKPGLTARTRTMYYAQP